MFELLFKYPADYFARGELVLAGPWWGWGLAVLAAAVAVPMLLRYRRAGARARRRDRVALCASRTALLAVAMLALFRPALVVSVVEETESIVAVLLDDSLSMRIADEGGEARSAFVRRVFHPQTGEVARAIAERFAARFFRFAGRAEALGEGDVMAFSGRRSDLGAAIAALPAELGGARPAAVVIVSDGAVTDTTALDEAISGLRAAGTPVHTVGVGGPGLERDVELTRVSAPRRVLAGSSPFADVLVTHRGAGGERVTISVEDGARLVATEEVTLTRDQPVRSVRMRLDAKEGGARQLRFRVSSPEGETLAENNARDLLLDVVDRRERILHFEGEPRFEVKFLRRAVAKDENLRVVSLIRTAENKHYRLGVESAEDLAGGFPREREELFAYRGLVLGSVEASYFTSEQLRMIADFVSLRGGGLLVLGGKRAFAEGGYAGTPLETVLPVVLGPKREAPFRVEAAVRPTLEGRNHPVTRLAAEAQAGDLWDSLPRLTVLHPLYAVKPGASVLLEGAASGVPAPLVVLGAQRFGRGQALVLNVQNTWWWQMHPDIPLEDQTHEILWRQLLRWLVRSVTERVTIETQAEDVSPGEAIEVSAQVLDAAFLPSNGAQVRMTVTTPIGDRRTLPMMWQPERDGVYRAHFTPEHEGPYDIRVAVDEEGADDAASAEAHVRVGGVSGEYFGARMHEALLRRMATETGGRFYTAEDASRLAGALRPRRDGATVQKRLALWDMPVVFLALIALMAFEWLYRRWRGLA